MFSKKVSKFDKTPKKDGKSKVSHHKATESTDEQKSVPDLICKSFADGCLVLGSVHQIAHDELTVTLPGINNFGYVKLNSISSEYVKYLQELQDKRGYIQLTSMYTIGQLLRCKVLSYTNKRLFLTIAPSDVNANLKLKDLEVDMIISGSVKSKEDHGYSVNLGVNEAVGFLKADDIAEDSQSLQVGKTLNFKITAINKRVVNLTLAESKEFDAVKYKANFNTYLPGSRLACNVEKAYKNGLKLSINGVQSLVGYMPINHLGSKLSSLKTLKSKYNHGDRIEATTIYINPYSKVIYLSALEHLTTDNSVSKLEEAVLMKRISVGSFIQDCKVIRHSFKGIYVLFNFEQYKNVFGFITKRDLIDREELEKLMGEDKANGKSGGEDEEGDDGKQDETLTQYYWKHITKEFVEKYFALNKVIENARVIDYTFIDNLVMLTTRKSKMHENAYMSYSDAKLKCGEVVKCTVVSAANNVGGLVVKLSDQVRGFIPKIHTADIPLKDPLAKMPLDKEIKCKIIQVNATDKKLILTAKKTLMKLKPEEEITAIGEHLTPGFITYGVIVAIKEYGLLVGFYNEVKALVPLAEIPSIERRMNEPVDLTRYYSVGQLVKCRVIQVDVAKQQLKMSLKLDDTQQPAPLNNNTNKQAAANPQQRFMRMKYSVGDLISAPSTEAVIQFKNFSKNYFFVKLTSGGNMFEFAVLYKNHLTDNEQLNDCLYSLFKKQTNLSEFFAPGEPSLLVLHAKSEEDSDKAFKKYFLTGKKSLINVYSNEIQQGESDASLYTGWVCKKQDKGVLIEIVSNRTELTTGTMAYCSNKIIKKQNLSLESVSIGQTVLCKIDKLQKTSNLILVNKIHFASALNFTTKYTQESQLALNCLNSTLNTVKALLKSKLLDGYTPAENDSKMLVWFKQLRSAKSLTLLSAVTVSVKSVDVQTNRVNCVYEESGQVFNAFGYLSIESSLDETTLVNSKLQAVVIGYDHSEQSVCLALEPKQQSFLRKHKHALSSHSNSDVLRLDHVVKGELIGFTSDYCVIALKQHAVGRLAYIPLLASDKIQSKNIENLNKLALLEKKVNNVKVKKEYTNYYAIGHVGKFMVKHLNDEFILCKLETKLKQRAVKPDEAELQQRSATKRKSSENGDTIEIVKSARKETPDAAGLGSAIDYPWEITNYDQFYELIRDKKPAQREEKASVDDAPKPPSKKQKKQQMETEDKEISRREEKLFERPLDANNAETPDDFERLLVSNPNSSLIWIRFIVYYLQSAEIEKSRNIAERALKAILYREEAERMNVWVAYLNLENMYGSTEKLEEVFQRAIQNCDTLKVYQHLAEIYARSSKIEDTQTLYNKMIRKFNKNPEVWIRYAIFEYKNANCDVARKLLIKCLNVLEKKDHIDIVNKFAQLEFKYGDVERAKTMYDSLLFTYPNRTDLWSVYIDMLVKYDRKNEARSIFSRIIQMNLNAKRMKFIFKKYLDFEKQHGDEAKVDFVKQMAMKYVENKEEVFKMAALPSQSDIEMLADDSDDLERNLIKKLKV